MRKFMQIMDFYPGYILRLEELLRQATVHSYDEYSRIVKADAYAISHIYALNLPPNLWDSQLIVVNSPTMQRQWWREFGDGELPTNEVAIALRQVDIFQPDVLHLEPIFNYDSKFIRALRYRPHLVCGWRAAANPPNTDWREIDLLLSNCVETIQEAPLLGAKKVIPWQIGFPRWLAQELSTITPERDVAFAGSYTPQQHKKRNLFLAYLATVPLTDKNANFTLDYYLNTYAPAQTPTGLMMYNRGALWGRDFYQMFRRHRINLNGFSDVIAIDGFNMRQIEVLGSGGFLLTQYSPGIEHHFDPDNEIVCFTNNAELVAKIKYYLEHESERQQIAANGQKKALAKYALEDKMRDFSELILTYF